MCADLYHSIFHEFYQLSQLYSSNSFLNCEKHNPKTQIELLSVASLSCNEFFSLNSFNNTFTISVMHFRFISNIGSLGDLLDAQSKYIVSYS